MVETRKTKAGSDVIIYRRDAAYLYGVWNDGDKGWYSARWSTNGQFLDDPEARTSLDLE